MAELCEHCKHDDPHTGAGLGVCLHAGCGCDGSGMTLAEAAQHARRIAQPPYSERRRLLRMAIIGDASQNMVAYQHSATYHAWVDAMADVLAEMSDRLAEGAYAVEARRYLDTQELERLHREPAHIPPDVLKAAARLGAEEARGE